MRLIDNRSPDQNPRAAAANAEEQGVVNFR